MAKPIKIVLKLNLKAGEANPAPPVGTALGPHGVNIQQFCLQYNEQTKERKGEVIPAEITIYTDGSFTFILKTPPAAELLKKAAGVEKGSAQPNRQKVGMVTRKQIREIAELKMKDWNAVDLEGAMKQIEGTDDLAADLPVEEAEPGATGELDYLGETAAAASYRGRRRRPVRRCAGHAGDRRGDAGRRR